MMKCRERRAVREFALMGCFVLAFSCAVEAAIPTKTECKAARSKLAELTSDDYKALKAKTKTNEQVGDALAGYADNEESAAGKFALLQDAFQQYVLGKSVDKAESVYSKAQTVGGVEYALEMARPSRSKLSAYATSKNAPAKALKERIMADEKSFQRVGLVKAKLKKAPGDESLCEQLGIEYAAIGDWESALAAFVTAAGEVAKVADWELNGGKGVDYTAATVGAFWWKFADDFPKRKNVEETMKLHAAMWYKLALDKDAFKGNEKTIIEKRVAETEKFGAAEQAEKELAAKKMATLAPIKLEFSKDNVVELIGCPAGEFMMGKKGDDNKNSSTRYHKVILTRPFWMSKYKVTHKVFNRYQKTVLTEEDKFMGGWNRVHKFTPRSAMDFLEWLNKSPYRKLLPKGYIFRLPTWAEWEYAFIANNDDPTDLYVKFRNGEKANMFEAFLDKASAEVIYKRQNMSDMCWGAAVGLKKPNKWGFYDLIGFGGDLTIDTVDPAKEEIKLVDNDKDPLQYADVPTKRWICRLRSGNENQFWIGYGSFGGWPSMGFYELDRPVCIHIVIGPDLIKERGYTAKAKKR